MKTHSSPRFVSTLRYLRELLAGVCGITAVRLRTRVVHLLDFFLTTEEFPALTPSRYDALQALLVLHREVLEYRAHNLSE